MTTRIAPKIAALEADNFYYLGTYPKNPQKIKLRSGERWQLIGPPNIGPPKKSKKGQDTDLVCKYHLMFPSRLFILAKRLRAPTQQQIPQRSPVAGSCRRAQPAFDTQRTVVVLCTSINLLSVLHKTLPLVPRTRCRALVPRTLCRALAPRTRCRVLTM